jgi:hypothetical protein
MKASNTKVLELLEELDRIASDWDCYEYGLPVMEDVDEYDKPRAQLVEAVINWLESIR